MHVILLQSLVDVEHLSHYLNRCLCIHSGVGLTISNGCKRFTLRQVIPRVCRSAQRRDCWVIMFPNVSIPVLFICLLLLRLKLCTVCIEIYLNIYENIVILCNRVLPATCISVLTESLVSW